MDALLQTKLRLPPLQPKLVLRPRLLAQLDAALHCRLILLCAPAGFGKSTLLTTWLHGVNRPIAWLALDEADDEPLRFWRYLIGALEQTVNGLTHELAPLLNTPESGTNNRLLTALVNRLANLTTPVILALDDYHLILDATIHRGIAFLLDHLPQQLQLVISSRSDPPLPLPRLRARNQLLELRTPDLRFLHGESARFLRERMGLTLAETEVAQLEARTEGWVAGLQFTGLSLQKSSGASTPQPVLAQAIARISGRDRHVVDYLLTEVLEQQPPAVQAFLLQTAILDRLCAPLCDALLGDGNGQQLLDYVERANLFLVALDEERQWYRYHHLFAELLRDRLPRHYSPTHLQQLHRHARDWYSSQGMHDAALEHALAAQDDEWVAGTLDALVYVDQSWQQERFRQLRPWLDRLPDRIFAAYPRLALAGLEASMLTFRAEGMAHYMQLLDSQPALPPDVAALLLSNKASLLRIDGRLDAAKALLREAMTLAPEEDLYTQVSIKEQMAVLLFEHEDVGAAIKLLRESADLAQQMGRYFTALTTLSLLGVFTIGRGELHQAAQIFTQVIQQAKQWGLDHALLLGLPQVGLGIIAYRQNDLEAATAYCAQGLAQSEAAELGEALWQGYQVQVWMALRQGDEATVERILAKGQQLLVQTTAPTSIFTLRKFYDFFAAEVALRRGDLAAVAHWVTNNGLTLDDLQLTNWYFYELLIQFYLARSRLPNPEPTVGTLLQKSATVLAQLINNAARHGRRGTVMRLQLLLALTHQALGESERALGALAAALPWAEREGYLRNFLDEGAPMRALVQFAQSRALAPAYIAKLLAAFQAEPAFAPVMFAAPALVDAPAVPLPVAQPFMEGLTEREGEVLQLIAQGLTNQEIAERLIISLATVKRHISNIYGKLGVTHRTEALVKAQALALLPS